MAACGQMGRFYDLPTGVAAGMADSKLPDAQSGYENAYTNILAGHSGANDDPIVVVLFGFPSSRVQLAALKGCELRLEVISTTI